MARYSNKNESTISDEIIAFLFSARSTYIRKGILWERIQKRRIVSEDAFRKNIYRLNKKGIIKISGERYVLSEKGCLLYERPYKNIQTRPAKKKRVIVLFDIPEPKKKVREWLRFQIKSWGFKMIQKSVWLGDGPLPKEFTERLRLLGVEKDVKVFTVQKTATI